MKKTIILTQIFVYLIINSCQSQNKDKFLDNFEDSKIMPYSEAFHENDFKIEKEILPENLSQIFHICINEIEYSETYQKNKYFYFGKYKLNENFYLIGYKKFYNYHEAKVVYSIFDINNSRITSSLVFSDELKINRRTIFKDGCFYINTTYFEIPNGLDPEPGKEFVQKTILEKYYINKNNIFEKIP